MLHERAETFFRQLGKGDAADMEHNMAVVERDRARVQRKRMKHAGDDLNRRVETLPALTLHRRLVVRRRGSRSEPWASHLGFRDGAGEVTVKTGRQRTFVVTARGELDHDNIDKLNDLLHLTNDGLPVELDVSAVTFGSRPLAEILQQVAATSRIVATRNAVRRLLSLWTTEPT